MNYDKRFGEFLVEAREDPNIIGFFLQGSRGKWGGKFVVVDSDYDIELIVKDKVLKKYQKKWWAKGDKRIGFNVHSLTSFKKWKPEDWQRYAYEDVKPLIDKNGKISKVVEKKAYVPREKIRKDIYLSLDCFINFVYRSLKCWRGGNKLGARLEANREMDCLLRAIFLLHGGRTIPYYKYIQIELEKKPLKKWPISSKKLLELIKRVIDSADIKAQQELLNVSEKVFRKHGHGKVFDTWPDLEWMKSFRGK